MQNIIKGELYKQMKTKSFVFIILASLLPFFFALLVYKQPSFLEMDDAHMGIWSFLTAMWQSAWSLLIPHILLVYLISKITDDERHGQVVYEITRTTQRTNVVLGKFTTIIILFFTYSIAFFSFAAIGFELFVRNTNLYSTNDKITSEEIIQVVISFCLAFLVAATLYTLSAFIRPIVTLIGVIIAHTAINSYLSESAYWKAIPGTLAYNMDFTYNSSVTSIFLYQLGTLIVLTIILLSVKIYHVQKLDVSF